MAEWTSEELNRIGDARELEIASLRTEGTLRCPRTVWVVRLGNDLFVHSVNGPTAAWYRGTRAVERGHIRAGGVERDVAFVDDQGLDDELDAAYREKYGAGTSPVRRITSPEARSTTIRLVPANGTE